MLGKFFGSDFLRYPETTILFYDLFSLPIKGWKSKEIKGFFCFFG